MAFDLVGKAVKNLRLPTVNYSSSTVAIVPAQENDTNSRYLRVTLYDDRGDISLENYTGISLNATLPDGSFQVADGGEIDRENNVAICKIASSLLTQPGKVSCDILLSGRDNNGIDTALTSQTFYLLVNKNQVNDEAIEASDELPIVAQLLCEMSEIRKETADVFETTERQQGEIRDVESGLANLASGVEKNSKRITNLEQGLMPDPFETDSTTAFLKVVPEGALPYAEVAKVGGMSYASENLAMPNIETIERNGFVATVDANGRLVVTGSANTAANVVIDFVATYDNGARERIPLLAGEEYSWSVYKNGVSLAEYVDGVNFQIEYTDAQGGTVWSWGAQDASRPRDLMRMYLQKDVVVGDTSLCGTYEVMLNQGTTVKPHSPYFEGLRHAKATAVKSIGANILPEASMERGYWDISGDVVSKVNHNTDLIRAGDRIPVLPNTTYYVSSTNGSLSWAVWCVDENYRSLYRTDSWNSNDGSFTTPSVPCYALFCGWYSGDYQNDIMINYGAEALPYKAYSGILDTLAIPSEVQALPGYGLGLNNSYHNYINWEEKKFYKIVGEVDLGTLDWNGFGGYFAHTGQIFKPSANVTAALPSHFDTIRVDIYGALVVTFSEDYGFTSADDVKAAMSGVKLVYELANYEIIDISDILPDDNFIRVESGGVTEAINEHSHAVPSEIVYQIMEGA